MGLSIKIVTLPFVPAAEGFDQVALEALGRQSEILQVTPAFFEHAGRPYWSLVIAHRPREAPGEQPVQVAARGAAQSSASGRATPSPGRPEVAEADWGLYQELRAWRSKVADVLGVPVYLIFTNRQLAEVARLRPGSLAALGSVPGVGESRLRKHGKPVLEVVARFNGNDAGADAEVSS